MFKEGSIDLDRGAGPGEFGETRVFPGATNFFAVQMLWGVVFARNSAQWEFLAFFIA